MNIQNSLTSTVSSCTSKELNHLGLVAAMFDELAVGDTVDAAITQDFEQRNVSVGQALKAMVVNGLGFANHRMYLVSRFFEGKPVESLIGPDVTAADLNDDVLGRALDSIYEADPTVLYGMIASKALQRLDLSGLCGHMDTTSFHTDGNYDRVEEDGVIRITRGYSRDHRPELNQFGLQMIADSEAGIPMMMAAMSGNDSDKAVFRESVSTHVRQLQSTQKLNFLVADSALYTADTLPLMNDIIWVTRAPENIALARDLIGDLAPDLAASNDGENYNHISVCTQYANVKQHWIVVYSPQANKRASHSVAKWCGKRSNQDQSALDQLCKQEFACEEDAMRAINKLKKSLKISMLHEIELEKTPHFKQRGRPATDAEPDSFGYHVRATLASDHACFTERLQRKSCFILATNQTDSSKLDGAEILKTYKRQQKVERGFRFLKDPMFLASSVFLKSPKRIMALAMVMTVCLLIYAALEHRTRKRLAEENQSFPSQTGKMTSTPTARWVFQYFQNIAVIYINENRAGVLNLDKNHTKLLKLLGHSFMQIYS